MGVDTIAVINDNDFTVARITVHPDGSFTRNYVPDVIQLGIIEAPRKGSGNHPTEK